MVASPLTSGVYAANSAFKSSRGTAPTRLLAEAEALAGDVLGGVSFLALADEVEAAVLQFDYDDLNARAGPP